MMFDIGADLQRAYDDGIAYAWEVAQKVFNSTVTFYEAEDVAKQIDKDINVRSKDEPQTDIHGLTDCDFCKGKNCEDCEGGKDEPQTDCFLCKWLGEVDVCGRCRNRNLFAEAEPQPRCPKCGKRGYIRSLESMGVKLKVFDEYKWKCTNCNKYFKEEPKDEPQTENLFTDKDGGVWEWRGDAWYCISGDEPQTDCAWK